MDTYFVLYGSLKTRKYVWIHTIQLLYSYRQQFASHNPSGTRASNQCLSSCFLKKKINHHKITSEAMPPSYWKTLRVLPTLLAPAVGDGSDPECSKKNNRAKPAREDKRKKLPRQNCIYLYLYLYKLYLMKILFVLYLTFITFINNSRQKLN